MFGAATPAGGSRPGIGVLFQTSRLHKAVVQHVSILPAGNYRASHSQRPRFRIIPTFATWVSLVYTQASILTCWNAQSPQPCGPIHYIWVAKVKSLIRLDRLVLRFVAHSNMLLPTSFIGLFLTYFEIRHRHPFTNNLRRQQLAFLKLLGHNANNHLKPIIFKLIELRLSLSYATVT